MNKQIHLVLYKQYPYVRLLPESDYYTNISKYIGIIKTYNADDQNAEQFSHIVKDSDEANSYINFNVKRDNSYLSRIRSNNRNYIWVEHDNIYKICDLTQPDWAYKSCIVSNDLIDVNVTSLDVIKFIANREESISLNSYFN